VGSLADKETDGKPLEQINESLPSQNIPSQQK